MSFVPLPSSANSNKRRKRRRGHVHGRYCGKGIKGEKSRAGRKHVVILEGGQMPLVRRLPKRGFSNAKFEKIYEIVNINSLESVFSDNDEITVNALLEKGLVRKKNPVKILGLGEITKPLKVKVDAISSSARAKIEKAGGTVDVPEKAGDPGDKSTGEKKPVAVKKTATGSAKVPGKEASIEKKTAAKPDKKSSKNTKAE